MPLLGHQEVHQEKLQEAKVAKCPIRLMCFNNMLTAKNHARYNHTDIITSHKLLNEIIEQRTDKSKAIDYKKRKTTQL